MRRFLGIVPMVCVATIALGEEGPLLIPPSGLAPSIPTSAPTHIPISAPVPSGVGPELIVPGGLTIPVRQTTPAPAPLPLPELSATPSGLDSPLVMPPMTSRPVDSPYLPLVTSEPLPAPAPDGGRNALPLEPIRSDAWPGSRPEGWNGPSLMPEPRRGGRIGGMVNRLFGRGPDPAPSPLPIATNGPRPMDLNAGGNPSAPDLADDEEVLRQRIERLVFATTDGQVRALEVIVRENRVHIRAEVDRFWQRRGVQRRIESLPALSRYQTSVEVH
ncbi:hypothetical protein BH23PLA1_BH23PLA1_43350 [soil metagenome]